MSDIFAFVDSSHSRDLNESILWEDFQGGCTKVFHVSAWKQFQTFLMCCNYAKKNKSCYAAYYVQLKTVLLK